MSVQAFVLRNFVRSLKGLMLSSRDPIQLRSRLESLSKRMPNPPRSVHYMSVKIDGRSATWAIPEGAGEKRAILYFHGGGFIMGSSLTTHRDFLWRLAEESGARVLALDYRLAPEHPFPAALDDALATYLWLLDQGYDSGSLAFAGDSAGGNLVFATALKVRDSGHPLPAALVGLSPWTDLTVTGESTEFNEKLDPILPGRKELLEGADYYLNGADASHPHISPLFGDYTDFPPSLIHVGSEEVLLDDSRRLAKKIADAGASVNLEVWPKMPHVWHVMSKILPEGKEATRRVGEFLRDQLG